MIKFTAQTPRLSIIAKVSASLFVSLFTISSFTGVVFSQAPVTDSPTVTTQTSPTQATTKYPGLVPSDYNSEGQPRCYSGGQPASCAVIEKNIEHRATWMIILLVPLTVGIAGSIFAIFMIIHAANHPVNNKTGWILFILFTSFIGGIIYYYKIKRPYDRNLQSTAPQPPPINPQQPSSDFPNQA